MKHIPTGLYYTPSKGTGNLTKVGKVYVNRLPDIGWTETIRIREFCWDNKVSSKLKLLCECFNIDLKNGYVDVRVPTKPEDWLIEEIQ